MRKQHKLRLVENEKPPGPQHHNEPVPLDSPMLSLADLVELCGRSAKHLRTLWQRGDFPQPRRHGRSRPYWLGHEVAQWKAGRSDWT